jgi:hypothetical protein
MKLKRRYRWWGLLGNIIQYGIPLSYIIWQYDIFQFEEAGNSITGWGFIVVAIIYFIFQNKIKDLIADYDNRLGQVAKKAKWGFIFIILGGLLAVSRLWIDGAMYFMLTLGLSNILALPFYGRFYSKKEEYKELRDLIKKQKQQDKIKGITA